jgi:metal-responsive CopG/Arc/MetJ family transcriptional regulator
LTDVLVSVRMPSTLVNELRALAEKNHFMDLSEEIRSIVRQKCLEHASPYNLQLKKIVKDIEEEVTKKENVQTKKELISNLKNLLEELQK